MRKMRICKHLHTGTSQRTIKIYTSSSMTSKRQIALKILRLRRARVVSETVWSDPTDGSRRRRRVRERRRAPRDPSPSGARLEPSGSGDTSTTPSGTSRGGSVGSIFGAIGGAFGKADSLVRRSSADFRAKGNKNNVRMKNKVVQ